MYDFLKEVSFEHYLLSEKRFLEEKFKGYSPVYEYATQEKWKSIYAWPFKLQDLYVVFASKKYLGGLQKTYTLGQLYFGNYTLFTRDQLDALQADIVLWNDDFSESIIYQPTTPIFIYAI